MNAGDLPLLTVSNSTATIINVEVVESTKGSAPFVNEVQQLTVLRKSDGAPAGMFDITFGANRSPFLSPNSTPTELVAALSALPGIRDGVSVNSNSDIEYSWTITFNSAGPQELLTSSCTINTTTDSASSLDCLLEDSWVEIRRLARGVSPASGMFRLRLVRADGTAENDGESATSTTIPLSTDASAETVQNALVALRGGVNSTVSFAPNRRAEYGLEWTVALNDNGVYSVELVDVDIYGPAPWCTDGTTGPAPADTPCEFPFTVDQDEGEVHFTCAGVAGSSLGWCSTVPTFHGSSDWGGCKRCSKGALPSPKIHVASRRRRFHLTGSSSDISRALSEVVYRPRAYWNTWLGGLDEVTAYWNDENVSGIDEVVSGAKARTVSHVFVAPVNDPPTLNVAQQHVVAYEGQEVLLEGADLGDPDLVERPEIEIRLTLEAELGALALGNYDGVVLLSGTSEPYSSRRLDIKGSLSTLQAAVKQVYYRPPEGLATGTASVRAVGEIQRIELTEPSTPMVQSITTSAVEGYIQGNFTLGLKCDAFFKPLKDIFPDIDLFNSTSTNSYQYAVQSPLLAADAPATGNISVEAGVRFMLTGCISWAWNQWELLAMELNTTLVGNISSAEFLTSKMLPHSAATAVVSGGNPDLHGRAIWTVTLIDVPASLPAFDVVSQNLTADGTGPSDTPYAYDRSSSSAGSLVSVSIIQVVSSSSSSTGSFTLAMKPGGQATQSMLASATEKELAAALSTLPDIGAVQVSTGSLSADTLAVPGLGRYWEVTFLLSGSPPHAGDVPLLIADDTGLRSTGGMLRVLEVAKGQAPADLVSVVVNDLGNVGSGESSEATASWNITIVPQDTPPIVRVNRTTGGEAFLRGLEGGEVHLPDIEIVHAVARATTPDDISQELQYLVRFSCDRGSAKPSPSAIGRGVHVHLVSQTVIELRGTLPDLNRALAQVVYSVPTRYRGVDNVVVGVRMAGIGIEGGMDSVTLYILIDGVNRSPDLSAPRSLRTTGASPVVVGGISVSDDDTEGYLSLNITAVRGVVSIPDQQLHRLLDVTKVWVR